MKTPVYFIAMLILFSMNSYAQNLEHFTIEKRGNNSWNLLPNFDKPPQSGVNGIMMYPEGNIIIKWVKNALKTLPEEIKQKVSKEEIRVLFIFNAEGKIFHVYFLL